MKGISLILGALFLGKVAALADAIVQWNFNGVTNTPSIGMGMASLIGDTSASYATGSTNDPAPSSGNSAWNTSSYPSHGTSNKLGGVQFNVSTAGYSNIVVRWDQRVSSSASKYYRFQYSTDGTTFMDAPAAIAMNSSQSSPSSYFEAQTNSLAALAAVNDNPNFVFRIVSEFESTATGSGTNNYVTVSNTTYSTAGTVRFDMVTVTGTLMPGANTPPVISTVPNQTIRVTQSTGPLPFTVGDGQDAANSLVLNKASSDPSVIPGANIVFGGSASNRTVTVSAGSQAGLSVITVYVVDTSGLSNSASFNVTVLPANTAPVISTLTPTNTLVNTATPPIGFIIYDLETPSAQLTVAGSSGNQAIVPNANILFGGGGSNRTATITPAAAQTGVAVITLSVSDGTNSSSSVFPLMVTPSSNVVFYEPFAYPDGSVLTNSGFLWGNRSGTVGECQVSGGQLQVSAAQTEDVISQLIGAPYARSNGFVLYASFKAKFLNLPKQTPGYFAHFASGSSLRGRVFAGLTNATPGSFRLFVANGSDTNTALPTDLSTNVTYTVVTRYNIDTATTTLWVNPAAESDPGATAGDAQIPISISSYGFRQDSSVGATVMVDDLRVGLSFAAVMSGANLPSPIPLTIQRQGGNVILSWSNSSFALQAATAVNGTFTNVTGATSPYTNSISGPPKYFRLKAGP